MQYSSESNSEYKLSFYSNHAQPANVSSDGHNKIEEYSLDGTADILMRAGTSSIMHFYNSQGQCYKSATYRKLTEELVIQYSFPGKMENNDQINAVYTISLDANIYYDKNITALEYLLSHNEDDIFILRNHQQEGIGRYVNSIHYTQINGLGLGQSGIFYDNTETESTLQIFNKYNNIENYTDNLEYDQEKKSFVGTWSVVSPNAQSLYVRGDVELKLCQGSQCHGEDKSAELIFSNIESNAQFEINSVEEYVEAHLDSLFSNFLSTEAIDVSVIANINDNQYSGLSDIIELNEQYGDTIFPEDGELTEDMISNWFPGLQLNEAIEIYGNSDFRNVHYLTDALVALPFYDSFVNELSSTLGHYHNEAKDSYAQFSEAMPLYSTPDLHELVDNSKHFNAGIYSDNIDQFSLNQYYGNIMVGGGLNYIVERGLVNFLFGLELNNISLIQTESAFVSFNMGTKIGLRRDESEKIKLPFQLYTMISYSLGIHAGAESFSLDHVALSGPNAWYFNDSSNIYNGIMSGLGFMLEISKRWSFFADLNYEHYFQPLVNSISAEMGGELDVGFGNFGFFTTSLGAVFTL